MWLKVASNLLMHGLSSVRRKLFDLQAFHNQAHIINLSDIVIYFNGIFYLYVRGRGVAIIWRGEGEFDDKTSPLYLSRNLPSMSSVMLSELSKSSARRVDVFPLFIHCHMRFEL